MSRLSIVNSNDRYWTKHRYLFWFGAYGLTRLLVWANSVDDALDEAIDYLAEHAPGLLADTSVDEEYKRFLADGMPEDEAAERSAIDTTQGGNCGHYLHSWEWSVVEDPTREQVIRARDE